MKVWTLGFAFSGPSTADYVTLIRKRANAHVNAGRMNGVGGKVEETDENARFAMAREFYEETGVLTRPEDWEHFGSIYDEHGLVYLFRMFRDRIEPRTMTDEPVEKVSLYDFWRRTDLADNLRGLVGMALVRNLNQVALQY